MVIKQALDDLRKFTVNDVKIFDRLLDVLYELHNRQHIHGNLITEIQRELKDNPLKPEWPDPPAEIKPCPFCGGAEIKKNRDSINDIYWFFCDDCNATADSGYTSNDARQRWNKRI